MFREIFFPNDGAKNHPSLMKDISSDASEEAQVKFFLEVMEYQLDVHTTYMGIVDRWIKYEAFNPNLQKYNAKNSNNVDVVLLSMLLHEYVRGRYNNQ
jgi:hypothetical protein